MANDKSSTANNMQCERIINQLKERIGHRNFTFPKLDHSWTEWDYFVVCLAHEVKERAEEPSALRKLSYEMASFILVGKDKFESIDDPLCIGATIHKFNDYQKLMSISGIAFVIASIFDTYIKDVYSTPSPPAPTSHHFNDFQRNENRIAGFFRDESQAEPFLKVFEIEAEKEYLFCDYPWFIDAQVAVLDSLEAIDYKESSIRRLVIEQLGKHIKLPEVNEPVRKRLVEVVETLRKGGLEPRHLSLYNQMRKEFIKHLESQNQPENGLLTRIEQGNVNIPYLTYQGEVATWYGIAERFDPVDSLPIEQGLAKVRIDYNDALNIF